MWGVLSAVLLVAALSLIVATQPRGKQTSISERAASRRWTYVVFSTTLTLCGVSFVVFMYQTFNSSFGLPLLVFRLGLFGALVCLLVTAWIPAKGATGKLHWYAAHGVGAMMTIMMAALATAGPVNGILRVAALLSAAWYSYTLYVWFFAKPAVRFTVVFQFVNIISFLGIFLTAAATR